MRSGTLNMRINPKIKYLAEISSRQQGRTLSGFIELALFRALADPYFGEPTPGTTPKLPWNTPMTNDELWDEDEAERLYKLATAYPGLLAPSEQEIWQLIRSQNGVGPDGAKAKKYRKAWENAQRIQGEGKGSKRK